jgi:uncharacterized protein YqgC (DUF456 family)
MAATLLIVLLLVAFVSWSLNWVGLPGNWILLGSVVAYDLLVPEAWRWPLGWAILVTLLILAALGELIEFFAGAVGTSRVGGTRRAAVYALIGSLVGGLGGAFVALPIPVVGPLIAAVLGSMLGALVGGIWGEYEAGSALPHSVKVGWGAAVGRLLGTLGKSLIGGVMLAVLIAGLFF